MYFAASELQSSGTQRKRGPAVRNSNAPLFLYQAFKNNSFFPLGSGKIDFSGLLWSVHTLGCLDFDEI